MRWILIGAAGALAIGGMAAAQQARLSAECRQEIVALCRMGGDLRDCLRTALPKLSAPCRAAISERAAGRGEMPSGMREVAFGADPKQRMDLAKPAGVAKAPVLIFVHGGGWSIGDKRAGEAVKAPHFTGAGWAYVSANYRLVPSATVEQQAADIASAIAWVRANAVNEGLDPDRIVLMGHSAGAHLVALVGTDPAYLKAAGVPLRAVSGVILLDGAGYDVPAQIKAPGNLVGPMYDAAFGEDVARQKALSPTLHATAPNVANWLILPIERRADSQVQSNALAAGLRAAGASTRVVAVPGESHSSLNKGLGEAGDFATAEVDRFLKAPR